MPPIESQDLKQRICSAAGQTQRRLRHLNGGVGDEKKVSADMADQNMDVITKLTVLKELDVIKKLIETCRDGQAGYLEAAEHARNGELRTFFSGQSMERARFAAELESVARRLGEADPSRSPSVANMMHRAWIDLKHKLGGGDGGVLGSVEDGEHNAKNHYLEALRADLPPEVLTILERQAESVSTAYGQVCALRSMYRNAA
jgi:uncharacterized protein (TIGR02284 family)